MNASYVLRLFILALAIYREARSEPFEGMLAVGQAIENRVKDRRWPEEYRDVILQPWQFSSFNPRDPNNSVWPNVGEPAWNKAFMAAERVLGEDTDFADGANHYYADWIDTPSWAEGLEPVKVIGRHRFYRL